jgi:hypothetical protein
VLDVSFRVDNQINLLDDDLVLFQQVTKRQFR